MRPDCRSDLGAFIMNATEELLPPQTKHEAKMMLGKIGMFLVYRDGVYSQDAVVKMVDDPNLRELFVMAGYVQEDGTISFPHTTMERWAAKAYEEYLNGDKRSVANLLFTKQLVEHLQVQQKLREEILKKGALHHATRYVEVSKLIGSMMPGFLHTDAQPTQVNVTLTDERKKEIGLAREDAIAQVESFEHKLIAGELVED